MEAIVESLRGFGDALNILCRPELLVWAFVSTMGVYVTSVLSTRDDMNLNSSGIHAFSALVWILSFSFSMLVAAQSIANHQMDSVKEVNADAFQELISTKEKFDTQRTVAQQENVIV